MIARGRDPTVRLPDVADAVAELGSKMLARTVRGAIVDDEDFVYRYGLR